MKSRMGFSLIELMICVAIIGLLASVAIPSFVRFKHRSNSTEAVVNLAAIGKSQATYFAEFGGYVSALPAPSLLPGAFRAGWPAGSDFAQLGWRPEGGVLFQYQIVSGLNPPRFTAEAMSDLDNDESPSFYAYVKARSGDAGLDGSFPGTTCVGTGAFNGSSGAKNLLETAAPCDGASGRSRF